MLNQGHYFGESAFLSLMNSHKAQRMGRAEANEELEVYGFGLDTVKECLG